jgi:hypothetical protein
MLAARYRAVVARRVRERVGSIARAVFTDDIGIGCRDDGDAPATLSARRTVL